MDSNESTPLLSVSALDEKDPEKHRSFSEGTNESDKVILTEKAQNCLPDSTCDRVGFFISWIAGLGILIAFVTVSVTSGHNAQDPLIKNDVVVLSILLTLVGGVFYASSFNNKVVQTIFKIIPTLLLCYFLPSLLGTAGVISANTTALGDVASNYFLPACLVLLTLSVDLRAIARLGPKALIMFFTATAGIVLGGPFAVAVVGAIDPNVVGGSNDTAIWRGLACIAGSWIGGGANQLAMKEIFGVSDAMFSMVIVVDVVTSNIWLACLLIAVSRHESIDRLFKANTKSIRELVEKMDAYQKSIERIPKLFDYIMISWAAFGITGIGTLLAEIISAAIYAADPSLEKFSLTNDFFWMIVLVTIGGLSLSFFKRGRALEGVGASKIGSLFLYLLIATIGMKMDVTAIAKNPGLFGVAVLWMLFHASLLLIVGRLIRAPLFFLAVASLANVGGAASAPLIASAVHPTLAPVGVLLAVLGYAVGTYGAYACGLLMSLAAPVTP